MGTRNPFLKQRFFLLFGILIALLLDGCRFCPQVGDACELVFNRQVELNELTDSKQRVVYEQPGTIIVFHGSGCTQSKRDDQVVLQVEQGLDLPAYATDAAVFLNGWRLRYLHDSRHVMTLLTSISNIRLERNTLKWLATGVLSDDDHNDPINWCYNFTVLGWNPASLKLVVDQNDGTCDLNDHRDANFYADINKDTSTSMSTFSSFLKSPDFAGSRSVAILPRGFGFLWDCGESHHLFQLAYNQDHSEPFIEKGKQYKKRNEDIKPEFPNPGNLVGSGFVSWQTSAIFNDDTTRRDYFFGEIVSGLGGPDVNIINPPFSILPEESGLYGACNFAGGVQHKDFVIDNIPYEFVIPMLTGWELNFGCSNDNHIAELGVSLDDFHYRDPNDPPGRLRYTLSSVMRDENNPGFFTRHKVTLLGFKFVGNGTPNERIPDLVPFSPSGNSPDAFCRMEQGNKLLRVTVKNQGNENAGASKTTVNFGNTSLTLDTPLIPAGGSVDLLFNVPGNCFQPDCSFRITVDSSNQINEGNNEGNNTASGGCVG